MSLCHIEKIDLRRHVIKSLVPSPDEKANKITQNKAETPKKKKKYLNFTGEKALARNLLTLTLILASGI